jgi:hypothetical protein
LREMEFRRDQGTFPIETHSHPISGRLGGKRKGLEADQASSQEEV